MNYWIAPGRQYSKVFTKRAGSSMNLPEAKVSISNKAKGMAIISRNLEMAMQINEGSRILFLIFGHELYLCFSQSGNLVKRRGKALSLSASAIATFLRKKFDARKRMTFQIKTTRKEYNGERLWKLMLSRNYEKKLSQIASESEE